MDDYANIIWRCMDGSQRQFTIGTDRARRYAPGFSPIVAFADPEAPAFEDLAPVCEPHRPFYCSEWSGRAPPGWQIRRDARMLVMAWAGAAPPDDAPPDDAPPDDDAADAVRLTHHDVTQMCALAELTRPGPFDVRTIDFGEYFGVFDGDRLIAMAGERMHDRHLREVSGICTHPEAQGRGLARRLTALVVRRALARGETPFLHVVAANARAITLYERMGFVTAREVPVRVVARTG
jgi:ribosomal protein S18 acetylase RimI-like enzyme